MDSKSNALHLGENENHCRAFSRSTVGGNIDQTRRAAREANRRYPVRRKRGSGKSPLDHVNVSQFLRNDSDASVLRI